MKKWLDTPELKKYEQFVNDWHYYLKDLERQVEEDPGKMKPLSMELLKRFYMNQYDMERDFYEQFYDRFRM